MTLELLREARRRAHDAMLEIYHIERRYEMGQPVGEFFGAKVKRDLAAALRHINSHDFATDPLDEMRQLIAEAASATKFTPPTPFVPTDADCAAFTINNPKGV